MNGNSLKILDSYVAELTESILGESLRAYQTGYKHGFAGESQMKHRKHQRLYDRATDRESYSRGYAEGQRAKIKETEVGNENIPEVKINEPQQ